MEKKREPRTKGGAGVFFKKLWENTKAVAKLAYKFRSVLLAIPVATGAIALAIRNMTNLPERVGMDLMANGEHAVTISRNMAVGCPLAVTAVCLLLMFCSKRVGYPWLISLFSLALPIVILIVNTYPY